MFELIVEAHLMKQHLHPKQLLHLFTHNTRVRHDDSSRIFESFTFRLRSNISVSPDRTGMSHSLSFRRCASCYHRYDRLRFRECATVLSNELRGLELCLTPDLSNYDDSLGFIMVEEELQSIGQGRACSVLMAYQLV